MKKKKKNNVGFLKIFKGRILKLNNRKLHDPHLALHMLQFPIKLVTKA